MEPDAKGEARHRGSASRRQTSKRGVVYLAVEAFRPAPGGGWTFHTTQTASSEPVAILLAKKLLREVAAEFGRARVRLSERRGEIELREITVWVADKGSKALPG